jgi:hypothetical protein
VATKTTPKRPAGESATQSSAPSAAGDTLGSLILPIGHYVGTHYRLDEPGAARQVRRGGTFHDLTGDQFAFWSLAHGTPEAVQNDVAWQRRSVEDQARQTDLAHADQVIDELLDLGLLVEVTPGDSEALDFARSHRLVPLMLGLGNSTDEPDMFGIGFLHQPVLQVSHAIYDLWQWSAMDDSLWATCENAADVARRSGSTNPDFVDPASLLGGLLGSLHALLLANAAYLDIDFRLRWPQAAAAGDGSATAGSRN